MTTAKKEITPSQFRDIAEHIAAILSDPHTPELLYMGITEALSKLDVSISVNENPDYVEAILLTHEARREAR
jgi:Mg-chelatase subunit ChlI